MARKKATVVTKKTGTVKTAPLISHRVPLEDYEKAFELAETPGNYRVSLMP